MSTIRSKQILFQWAAVTLTGILSTVGCGQGAFESKKLQDAKASLEEPAVTGFKDFNDNDYSVDGDSDRTTQAKNQLLSGFGTGDAMAEQLAQANLAFAASIQSVTLSRFNSQNQESRWGRVRFQIDILSDDPQTQLKPLVFKGVFSRDGQILKINPTPAEGLGNQFILSGAFQDIPEKGKIFGSLDLKNQGPNGSTRAQSKINVRTYLAHVNVRTPNDLNATPGIQNQIQTLKSSVAWVENRVVALGRSFYKYDLISISELDNTSSETADSQSIVQLQGESLQTVGFDTSPVTSIRIRNEAEVQATQAELFGADDEGMRSFQIDIKDEQVSQDLMLEIREEEEVKQEDLDPNVQRAIVPPTISEETVPEEITPEEDSSVEEDSGEVSRPVADSDVHVLRPQPRPEGLVAKTNEEHTSLLPRARPKNLIPPNAKIETPPPDVFNPDENSRTNKNIGVTDDPSGARSYEGIVDPHSPRIDEEESESNDEPGFFGSLWNSVFGDDDVEESKVIKAAPYDEVNRRTKDDVATPITEKIIEDTSVTTIETEGQTADVAAIEEVSPYAPLTSIRPRSRPKNLNTRASNPRPRRNQPDLEITGINYGLDADAFLKIAYDQKQLPGVAKGLHDMEEHYAYPDIRKTWIPRMRDQKGRLMRNFWTHAYPVRDLISQVFEHYDILPTLAYVTILESTFLRDGNFAIQLTSAAVGTAYGPFQLLRGTANVLGLRTDTSQKAGHRPANWDERNWFVPSLCGAAKHFKASLEHFGHADTTWAILAYHAGDRGASDEIADSLSMSRNRLWNNISRYNYTYQEIKANNKFQRRYVDYVDQKIAAYFILQSPGAMSFELPSDVRQNIPEDHRHKFFPNDAIKDSSCEEAAAGWRDYFQGRAS